jgi:hypothetical protein
MDPSPPHSVLVTGLWALVSSVSALIMLLLSALIMLLRATGIALAGRCQSLSHSRSSGMACLPSLAVAVRICHTVPCLTQLPACFGFYERHTPPRLFQERCASAMDLGEWGLQVRRRPVRARPSEPRPSEPAQ